jgi:hypothetical protein
MLAIPEKMGIKVISASMFRDVNSMPLGQVE